MPVAIDERVEVLSIMDTVRDLRRTPTGRYFSSGDILLAALVHRVLGSGTVEALRAIAFETHVGHHPSRHRPDRNHPAHEWGNMSGSDEEEEEDD